MLERSSPAADAVAHASAETLARLERDAAAGSRVLSDEEILTLLLGPGSCNAEQLARRTLGKRGLIASGSTTPPR